MTSNVQFWLGLGFSFIVAPLIAYLFRLLDKANKRVDDLEEKQAQSDKFFYDYREAAAYKFATLLVVNDLDNRVVKRLDRIEDKIDSINERNMRRDKGD